MPLHRTLRRLLAGSVAIGLGLAGLAVAPAATAADPVAFTVDDFRGNAMGPYALVPPSGCDLTDDVSLTPAVGSLRISFTGHDSNNCPIPNAKVRWTADTAVNVRADGADRITLRYRDVLPDEPSAVMFSLALVDTSGRTASVGGISRNGGADGDFLTLRYEPEYPGDVAFLSHPSDFDWGHVKTFTLGVTGKSRTATSVTLEGLGFTGGEPVYEAPVVGGPDLHVLQRGVAGTASFSVSGYPAPTVTVSGAPAWLTVGTSRGTNSTAVTLSADPAPASADVTLTVRADVANSLQATRTIRVLVPSVVAFTPTGTATTAAGSAGPLPLGNVSSIPAASVTASAGLPAGTALSVQGGVLQLTGTPTSGGSYPITATLDSGYATAAVSRTVVVTAPLDILPIAARTVPVDQAITPIDVTVTGYPDVPTTTVSGLPAGLVATATATGVRISGTPRESGAFVPQVRAYDSSTLMVRGFDLTVTRPAAVEAPATATLREGVPATILLVRSGWPVPTLTVTGLPSGLALSSAQNAIVGTPAPGTGGVHTVVVTPHSSVGDGPAATTVVTVEAAAGLTGPAALDTLVGAPLAAEAFVATGYPAPTLTWSVEGGTLPEGVTAVTGSGTLRFEGSPTTTGTWTVTVTAENGVGAPATLTRTLRSLAAPVFADPPPVLTFRAGAAGSHRVPVGGHPAPTLTLSAGTLPAWLTFDAATGTFSGEPAADDAGEVILVLTADNETGTASVPVRVRVELAPTLALASSGRTVRVGEAVDVAVGTVTGFPVGTVTAAALPAGLELHWGAEELRLVGTPATTGSTELTVVVDNGVGRDEQAWTLVVDEAPTLSVAPTATVSLGQAITPIPLAVGGYPAPVLTSTTLPAGVSLVQTAEGWHLQGAPTSSGTWDLTFTATSPAGEAQATLTLVVTEAPRFTATPGTTDVLLGSAVDVAPFGVAGHPLPAATFTGLPAGLSASLDGALVRLTGTPTATGSYPVVVRLENGTLPTVRTWTVRVVEAATLAPVADFDVEQDQVSAPTPISVGGYPAPALTAVGLPPGLVLAHDAGWSLAGVPTTTGSFDVTLTADNGVGGAAETTVTIDVVAAPAFADPSPVLTFPAGVPTTHRLDVTGHRAPALAVTGTLPAWLTFDAATATFSGTAPAADAGELAPLTVDAVNALGSASAAVVVRVTTAPAFAAAPTGVTVLAGEAVDLPAFAFTGFPAPAVTAAGLPDGLRLVADGTGARLVGTARSSGVFAATVTLDGASAATASEPWTVRVHSPATLAVAARTVTAVRGEAIEPVALVPGGFPAPVVTADDLPAGLRLAFVDGERVLAGTPVAAGTWDVTVTASNSVATVQRTVHVVVTEPEPEPTTAPTKEPTQPTTPDENGTGGTGDDGTDDGGADDEPGSDETARATPEPTPSASVAPVDGADGTDGSGDISGGSDEGGSDDTDTGAADLEETPAPQAAASSSDGGTSPWVWVWASLGALAVAGGGAALWTLRGRA